MANNDRRQKFLKSNADNLSYPEYGDREHASGRERGRNEKVNKSQRNL